MTDVNGISQKVNNSGQTRNCSRPILIDVRITVSSAGGVDAAVTAKRERDVRSDASRSECSNHHDQRTPLHKPLRKYTIPR